MQVEAAEDHVHLRHVVVVIGVERVVEARQVRPRRIDQAQIVEPAGVTCCGFAGDRGFVVPELNKHALRKIHDDPSLAFRVMQKMSRRIRELDDELIRVRSEGA
mgnify:CR=1 FL=1